MLKRKLRKQFEYAGNKSYEYLVVVGPKDLEKKAVTVRNMKSGKEKQVKVDKLVSYFGKMIGL